MVIRAKTKKTRKQLEKNKKKKNNSEKNTTGIKSRRANFQ